MPWTSSRPPCSIAWKSLRLSGYSEEEKLHIAMRYLVPRQLAQAGLTPIQLTINPDAIRRIITGYTREAGVRDLERMLARVARKVARKVAQGETQPIVVDPGNLVEMLGPERFFLEQARDRPRARSGDRARLDGSRRRRALRGSQPVARRPWPALDRPARGGDARVGAGGPDLRLVARREAGRQPRRGSVRPGLHIHVPAGAVPKDGPSAGVTMATALTSLYTGLPVRSHTAMTGEITLTGLVLPVGGIKEKMLAAHRAGIRRVILPKANEKDLRELPESVRREMEFTLAERIENVLKAAIPELASRLSAITGGIEINIPEIPPRRLKEIGTRPVFLYGGTV